MITVKTIDAHAAGEPLRLIVDGFPSPPGRTMLEKREWVKAHADHLRLLVREARDSGANVRIGDDDEAEPLRVPRARNAPARADDPFEWLAMDRLRRVVADEAPGTEQLAELHQSYEMSSSSEPSGSRK